MSFSQLVGNPKIKEKLLRSLAEERLPQSLIFAGMEGIGKRQFALAVAQALNCPQQPNVGCGTCPTCIRIVRGEYPDVQMVTPDGNFIKIAQVREVLQKLVFEPFEGNCRVVIFDAAERMNANSANALLKMLEEPPAHARLILISSSPQALLETIRSRCQVIRFAPLGIEEIEAYLRQHYPRPADEIRLLARVAQGSPGRVAGLDLSEFRTARKEVLELIELLGKGSNRVRLLKAAGHFGKQEREAFENRLDVIDSVLRDVLCVVTDAPGEMLTHADVTPKLKEISQFFTPAKLAGLLDSFGAVRRDLMRNVNRTMALEAMFLTFVTTRY
ncbi:MAG: DNA polymerase III subunit delta' [Blastocatellia bacterium]|nr:DNA polymerase III subunit delta' [Blastocatellia bacterium]